MNRTEQIWTLQTRQNKTQTLSTVITYKRTEWRNWAKAAAMCLELDDCEILKTEEEEECAGMSKQMQNLCLNNK